MTMSQVWHLTFATNADAEASIKNAQFKVIPAIADQHHDDEDTFRHQPIMRIDVSSTDTDCVHVVVNCFRPISRSLINQQFPGNTGTWPLGNEDAGWEIINTDMKVYVGDVQIGTEIRRKSYSIWSDQIVTMQML